MQDTRKNKYIIDIIAFGQSHINIELLAAFDTTLCDTIKSFLNQTIGIRTFKYLFQNWNQMNPLEYIHMDIINHLHHNKKDF